MSRSGDGSKSSAGREGREALDALFWRDEILQALYWMQGEGLADATDAASLAPLLAGDVATLARELERLAGEGDLVRDDGRYRLSERGAREGARRFQQEFAELTHLAHGECAPGCSCHDPAHAGEPCPSHSG